MAGQILVALNSHHRFEDIIPYIEEVAKPGMRVAFLFRYPVDPRGWLQDHWVTTESSREAMLAGRKINERYSWERQSALAEKTVAPWRQVLQTMGVMATVDVYTGSFASVLESYGRGGKISLIIRAQDDFPLMRFLHGTMAFVGLFKKAYFRPVLSLRPGQ